MPRTGSCVSCSTASWKLVKRWCADVFLNFVVPESSRLLTRLCRHELAAPPALSAETRLCTQEPAVGVLLDEAPLAMRQIFCERCLHITPCWVSHARLAHARLVVFL